MTFANKSPRKGRRDYGNLQHSSKKFDRIELLDTFSVIRGAQTEVYS